MSDTERKPDAWIIESKAGIWLTQKPEVAEKNKAKPGTIVTPYFSKKAGRRMIAHIILSFLHWFQMPGRRYWVVPPPGNRAERRAAAKSARKK